MSNQTISVVLAGVGGQGILLASEIVARAAMFAGHDVKTNEVHGMAQRGGSVIAQIRYGKIVNSPLVEPGTAQAVAAFEQVEGLRYAEYLAPGGLAVVSSQVVIPVSVSSGGVKYPEDSEARLRKVFPRLIFFNADQIATDLGNLKASNVVIMGALSTGLDIPIEAWHESIKKSVKAKFVDLNLKAFDAGIQQKNQG